ncbi:MAG: YggS family pyridoxal phosphate-dependent enzyme [gamma proteobacterium symbiont of Bathyaustriella thionipta]|nr:YggS family pyridoxal phosphate-dependent enzyme [gamma proteobacterium symbiont of Bathyaustriella thionipta]
MNSIEQRLSELQHRITIAAAKAGRHTDEICLLGVSKTYDATHVEKAWRAGLTDFGESYLQEAQIKIAALQHLAIHWHFIGRIQSNKTRIIAEQFDWVHSLYQMKHAQRLNEQRPADKPPLKVCLQVNISQDPKKGGLHPADVHAMIAAFRQWPGLSLQGLMVLPAFTQDALEQRRAFARLRALRDDERNAEYPLETLSMGMSADFEQAIAEGATIIRIGTALFGERCTKSAGA